MKIGSNGLLEPDKTYTLNGVTIHESIIANLTVWTKEVNAIKAGFKRGDFYKAQKKLSGGSGKIQGITVHNTYRVAVSPKTTPAEQYSRATYYENMGSARVHYYVDDTCAWQNLYINEVGWHAGDGNTGTGNSTTVGIEIIMDETDNDYNKKARDNAVKLIAYLLKQYNLTIENVYTHTYFINLRHGIKGTLDYMNTYKYPGVGKYCPLYILPDWKNFKAEIIGSYNKIMGIAAPSAGNQGSAGSTAPTSVSVKLSSAPYSVYSVKVGDYWYKIARKFNVELAALLAVNNMTASNVLRPNQVIKIPTTSATIFEAGNKVQFKSTAKNYYPGGPAIPNIMKNNYNHIVTRTTSNGQKIYKGGDECVLLGRKVLKSGSTKIENGINTWVSIANIEKNYQ